MTEMWIQLMTIKEFNKMITYGKGLSPTARIIQEEFNAVKFRQDKRIADLNKAFNKMNIFQNTIKSYIDDDDLRRLLDGCLVIVACSMRKFVVARDILVLGF